MDDTGYPIVFGDEVVLIFGGLTYRNKTFGPNNENIFENCEDYATVMGNSTLPDNLKSCGEELLNDMWRYHVSMNIWTPVKYDYDHDTQTTINAPTARYGHAGSYVELDD